MMHPISCEKRKKKMLRTKGQLDVISCQDFISLGASIGNSFTISSQSHEQLYQSHF